MRNIALVLGTLVVAAVLLLLCRLAFEVVLKQELWRRDEKGGLSS